MRAKPSSYELALLGSMVVLLAWSGHPAARPVHLVARGRAHLHRRARPDLALPAAPPHPAGLHAGLAPRLILMLGGHYTYAQVPLGFWMEGAFGFTPE